MTGYRPPVGVVAFARLEWERLLPIPGQVLVRVGDKVEAMDVVARALQPGAMYAVNAARALGVGNSALPRYMLKAEGEDVQEREVLAAKGGIFGLFRKRCVAPVAGSIASVAQGRILLEREPVALELRAYVRGEVSSVIPDYGAIISSTGALVRGAWSSGQEGYGIVRVVGEREAPLTADLIDSSCHGALVVGGASVTQEALAQAQEAKVRAVVVGGMEASLREYAAQLDYPVVVTQGFGELPMALPAYELFEKHQGREAAVALRQDARGAARPEVLIALPSDQEATTVAAQWGEVGEGRRALLTRAPFAGLAGRVLDAAQRLQDPDTGLAFWGVHVLLDDGRTLAVPLTNLDLIQESHAS